MSKLDQIVYCIIDGEIITTTIGDYPGNYIDEMPTPHGIGAAYHVRETELWKWEASGRARRLGRYATEAEAIDALDETFLYDFWHADDIDAYTSLAAAEAALAEQIASTLGDDAVRTGRTN